MKDKVIGIVLLVIGILCALLLPRTISNSQKDSTIVKEAVYVGDGKIKAENEGKQVIVVGSLTVTEPARDPDKNLEFPSPRVTRLTQVRESVREKDSNGKTVTKYNWDTRSSGSGEFFGKGTIGDFRIADSFIKKLPLKEYHDEAMLNKNGMILYEDAFDAKNYFAMDEKWKGNEKALGAVRYWYQAYIPENPEAVTMVGVQRGDALEFEEDSYYAALDGRLSREDIAKNVAKSNRAGIITNAVIAVIFLLIGFLKIVSGFRNRTPSRRLNRRRDL